MDFPDWEFLPDDDPSFDLHHNRIIPPPDSKNPLDPDFILCPPPISPKFTPPPPIPSESKNPDEVKSQVSFETKENEFVDTTVNRDASKFEREMGGSNKEEDKNSGFNLWKWSLTGVGAICTFGVTAATICVLILGTHQKNKHHANQKNVITFYTDDKRIKRVMDHTTRWNEAISASVRNGPISRAHITYGAYPDGLVSID